MGSRKRFLLLLSAASIVGLLLPLAVVVVDASSVTCTTDHQCEAILRNGSQCIDGRCTNPFYHGGCLKSALSDWQRPRICNSDDPPEAEELGYCRTSPMGYEEVRIASRNWESANFIAWILQILLSEVLDVPTSIEGGTPHVKLNLYDINSAFDYGSTYTDFYYKELEVANRVKDCRQVTTRVKEDDYEACFHVAPEVWWEDYPRKSLVTGIESLRELQAMGENAVYIPKFAAEQDPSLVSYIGWQGEKNRRKIAETFRRPVRWKHYCEEVSTNNCTDSADPVARRLPRNKNEEESFFVDGEYTGHFSLTDKANCTKYQHGCTGVFIDYQCGWTSFMQQRVHHMHMAFDFEGSDENGGYAYWETVQIYQAANATKSPVALMWWTPEPLHESFLGTDAEFTRVLFQPPTQECVDARADLIHQCSEDVSWEGKMGEPEGVCDTFPQVLQKIFATSLREITMGETIEEEFWSPAFDVLSNFKIDNRQLDQIFKHWQERGTDKWNFDPRDASCQWVVDNLDLLKSFIPESHPRVIVEVKSLSEQLFEVAYGLSICAILVVIIASITAFFKRKTQVFYHLQSEFLCSLLLGMLLVAVGAMILSFTPSTFVCLAIPWVVNMGFILQFIPLVVRIAAISQLATEGKQMQRVRLRPGTLYGCLSVGVALIFAFILAWMFVDPPDITYDYQLTDDVTPEGQQIVRAQDYCGSELDFWNFLTFTCHALLLLSGCMLAFIATRVKEDINDTRSMSLLIFLHMGFLLALMAVFLRLWEESPSDLMGVSSIILSLQSILAIIIYLLPKFWYDKGETIEEDILPDLFVHTTVAMLDVVGFCSWASVREPVQVFQFLEQLYDNIDKVAERFGVFKVETIGEIYVAATGVPKAQNDHPILMANFALTCIKKMPSYVKMMETRFGPDTGDLSLRVGMHSGPVTGGCLAGKGARRFQLFGDTMNMAQLIVSNSMVGKIHLSEATAKLLINMGKSQWVTEREDKLRTPEKGEFQTYWLSHHCRDSQKQLVGHDNDSSLFLDATERDVLLDMKSEERWVEWNLRVFENLLKQIMARRTTILRMSNDSMAKPSGIEKASMPLEEVKEIIELPTFDKRAARRQRDNQNVEVSAVVLQQLKIYITEIAGLYNPNPFHNFGHASYVVMAVTKYMNRIIAATEVDFGDNDERLRSSVQAALHDHTYGITSDPLTHFACAFSALIHDVQHPGVPNNKMIEENKDVAFKYKERSVAEQNSLDISWNLLMQDRFSDLLSAICGNAEELRRFRQLVVNSVMATDLGDKEMKALRNGRWSKAFAQVGASSSMGSSLNGSTSSADEESPRESKRIVTNRKATIVIEHLIQAADVAHMSQHWSIYRKWNERLFRELYQAYREGRSDTNPAENWYKGEIGFFDFYIIPLSEKLRDCGVFGPTSDENLNYATNNRNMWKQEGEAIVADMLKRVEAEYDSKMGGRQSSNRECAKLGA